MEPDPAVPTAPSSTSIDERLRRETKQAHAALEKAMMPLLRASVNAPAYGTLLRLMLAYLEPVEAAVLQRMDATALPDAATRRNTHLLKQDLEALGQSPATPVDPARLPAHLASDTGRAWGALYVLEGSTLGGQVVRSILLRQFPEATAATAYFYGYGRDTAARWVGFREALNRWCDANPQHTDAVIAGAQDTFTFFQNWLQAPHAF